MDRNEFLENVPEAIFFDFDGVILESSSIKTDAFVELFSHLNESQINEIQKYHINNMGVSRYKKFEWIYKELLNKEITEKESRELGLGFTDIVFEKIINAPFVPGIEDLLNWTKVNTINFVASGTPQEELRKVVEKRDLGLYFREVLGSPDSKAEIVNAMIEKYKLDRSRCWFIGDANTDYKAAIATDLKFIARNTAEFSDYWLAQKDIIVVEDFSELFQA